MRIPLKSLSARIFCSAALVFLSAGLALADEPISAETSETSRFKGVQEAAGAYFVPLSGVINSVEGGTVSSDISSSAGAAAGMRVSVLRKGKPFMHPLTKEPMGWSETDVGVAEFVEVAAGGSRLRVLSGEAREGDMLRRSSAPVRALFYQSSDVDWDVSEEYYLQLKDAERFEIVDAAPGSASDEGIAAEARRLGAEVAIVLAAEYPPGKMVLTQRLIWASDAGELSSLEVVLEEKAVAGYKAGEEVFSPKKNVPLLTFRMPMSVGLVAVGDFDGDGEKELALSTGHDVRFYTVGLSLSPAFEGAEIENSSGEEHVWLDAVDLDGDGRDEVVLSSIDSSRAVSYVYKFSHGAFTPLMKKPGFFVRAIAGKLYGQEYTGLKGFKGELLPLSSDGSASAAPPIALPKGLDIYDFSPFPTPTDPDAKLAYDERGYVALYGGDGAVLWRSGGSYAKPIKQYEGERPSEIVPTRKWTVKDRIINRGDAAIVIARQPVSNLTAGGLWYKGSKVIKLYWKGDSVGESILLGEIPGKLLDYAVADGKVYVLLGSMGIAPESILRGGPWFSTKLYVYSLNGG